MNLISCQFISEKCGTLLKPQQFQNFEVANVLPPPRATERSLVFVSNSELLRQTLLGPARVLILSNSIYEKHHDEISDSFCVWTTENIHYAMTVVLPIFDQNASRLKTEGVHATAVIHSTATIGTGVSIGAGTVVGANCKIGDGTVLHPLVVIEPDCEIGANCIIHSHTTVGSDGFGFYTDKNHQHHKISQIGKVVIEDNCEIGAHCAIDRATLTETRIGKGSKFDNFCHIAHNVQIGEGALIAAGFIVAGSTIIGKNFMASGSVHVLGHIKITDNVILTGRACALKDITEPGMYGGFPLETQKESVKTLVSIPQIKKLRQQLKKVLKHLNLNDE